MARAEPGEASHTDLVRSAAADVPAWWSRPGDPAWTPDADWGTAFPRTLAGHVRGGWTLTEPARAHGYSVFPGVFGSRSSIAWFDSVSVARGPGAAWRGWEAAQVELAGDGGPAALPGGTLPRARGDFTYLNGTSGFEEYALSVQRGDSLGWLRAESSSWECGGIGPTAISGRHSWGGTAGVARGMHTLGAAVEQRGHAARLVSGEEQSVSGGSGYGSWEIRRGLHAFALRAGRGEDVHESFGGTLDVSRREAERERAEIAWHHADPDLPVAARLEWSHERVTRIDTSRTGPDASALWAAVRGEGRLGDGRLELSVGAGQHQGVDRFEIAPSVAYAFVTPVFDGRLTVERVLAPVWTDLAPGQGAFLQSTWAAGLQIGARSPRLGAARLAWRMGRTRDRAVASRAPIEELWLRRGFRVDPRRYDFGLLTGAAEWGGPTLGAGAGGFVLARRASPAQPLVDPGHGARAWAEGGGRFFSGDLGVALRLEAAMVGPRESEASPSRRLDGYVTLGATVTFTLVDVIVTVAGRNLEDEIHPLTWVDPSTGLEAIGARREMVFTLTWRLFN